MVEKRRGRPRGSSDVPQRLLDAAQQQILAGAPAPITARGIAAEVGVSHSLVNYHFGSLDALLARALALAVTPRQVLDRARTPEGGIDTERLAHGFVAVWEHPVLGARLAALARDLAAGEAGAPTLSRYLERAILAPLVEILGIDGARRAAVSVVGMIFSRYVLRLSVMTSPSPQQVAAQLARMIEEGRRG